MPKNAVQRLQKIEKDIKTVISIFETSKKDRYENHENAENLCADQFQENIKDQFKCGKLSDKLWGSKNSICESFRKDRNTSVRSPQPNDSRESLSSVLMKKPKSPLSSKSMILIRESECKRQQDSGEFPEKTLSKAKTFYNLKDSSDTLCKIVKDPIKMLDTSSEVVQKIHFPETEEDNSPTNRFILMRVDTDAENNKKESTKPPKSVDANQSKHLPTRDIPPAPRLKRENPSEISRGNRSNTSRKEITRQRTTSEQEKKNGNEIFLNSSSTFYTQPVRIIPKRPSKNAPPTKTKANSSPEENFPNDNSDDRKRQNYHEIDKIQERLTNKIDIENSELWTMGLYENSEAINEKLDNIKVFKELALDIVNYIKNKYDDARKSKELLQEKVKKLEKNNDRLNHELKEANESKNKFQQKLEELMGSINCFSDEDIKSKDLTEKLTLFTLRVFDSLHQHKEEIYEKQKMIEKLQKDRLSESRNDLRNREILTDELQRLTYEKSELLMRLNQTRNLLKDRESQMEKLNDHVQKLEKEVQNQSQNLKIKTNALQEATEEMETLRKKLGGVEDVEELKNQIDYFKEVQENLIQQGTEQQELLKANKEEIKQLKEENQELKNQMIEGKDEIRIKNKIIEDHQETVKQLKQKAEEAKTILQQKESLERVLNIEREEKLELQEAVECLKRRKEELKKKVKDMESTFLFDPEEVLQDLQKTHLILQELENQVQIKEKEWSVELQLLLHAKEQACNVAEFATKKLMETSNELQRQSHAYKCLKMMFAEEYKMRKTKTCEEQKKEDYDKEETAKPYLTLPNKSES